MWVLGVYVYLAVFYLIKKIDVNSIYKVNRRIRLILTFKSSASYTYIAGPNHLSFNIKQIWAVFAYWLTKLSTYRTVGKQNENQIWYF